MPRRGRNRAGRLRSCHLFLPSDPAVRTGPVPVPPAPTLPTYPENNAVRRPGRWQIAATSPAGDRRAMSLPRFFKSRNRRFPGPALGPAPARSYVAHVRGQIQGAANFLSAVQFSREMINGSAGVEEWLVAVENLYHGMLCLLGAQVSLSGAAPVATTEVQAAAEKGGRGALFRELLAEFDNQVERLSQMSAASRLALLSLLVQDVRSVYGDVAQEQADWSVDPRGMEQVDEILHQLMIGLLQSEYGISLPF